MSILEQKDRLTRRPDEVSALIGVSRNGVYELIRQGKIKTIRVGRKILVPLASIDDFLKGAK